MTYKTLITEVRNKEIPVKNLADLAIRHARNTKTSKDKSVTLAVMAAVMTPQATKTYVSPLVVREAIITYASHNRGEQLTARELTGKLILKGNDVTFDTVQNVLRSLSREKVVKAIGRQMNTGRAGRDSYIWQMM